MGLADAISTALIKIKADVSQAKAEIKSLRATERQAAQERLAEIETANSGIDSQVAMLGKVTAAIGVGVAAFKIAQASAKAYLEDVRLQSAAAGANLENLRRSTRGLVEDDNLLAFAGKTMHGVWKLNQGEMETVLKGADALRKTMGLELQPTVDALTEALTKGNTRALKEFGIEARDKAELLQKLGAIWRSTGGDVSLAGDEYEQLGVQFKNAMDDIKGSIGEIVIALAPLVKMAAELIHALNQARGFLQDHDIGPMRAMNWVMGSGLGYDAARDMVGGKGVLSGVQDRLAASASARQTINAISESIAQSSADLTLAIIGASVNASSVSAAARGARGRGGKGGAQLSILRGGGNVPLPEYGGAMVDRAGFGGGGIDMLSAQGGLLQQQESAKAALKLQRAGEQSYLATLFGPLEEFKAYAEGFDILRNAATTAFDAWITGSESIGKAFSKAIAEGLRSTALQLLAESIKHAAFALGSLAFGDLRGASTHGAAAAKFAAGAIAVGVIAKQVGAASGAWGGGGGGGGAGGVSRAGNVVGRGGSGGGDNRTVVVYVGAEWGSLSAREQAGAIVRAMDLGKADSPHIRRRW